MNTSNTYTAQNEKRIYIVVRDLNDRNILNPGLPVYKIAVLENLNDRTWSFLQTPGPLGEEDLVFYLPEEAGDYLEELYDGEPEPEPEKSPLKIVK